MNKNDHTAFQVSNMDAALKFYTESLGLRLLSRSISQESHEAIAFLELDGGSLELIEFLDEAYIKPVLKPPYCPHFALGTEDMAQVLAMISANGITVIKGPNEHPGEVRWIYISDPDNNVIEYIQWLSKK
jgi:lactoylglutathione lyase